MSTPWIRGLSTSGNWYKRVSFVIVSISSSQKTGMGDTLLFRPFPHKTTNIQFTHVKTFLVISFHILPDLDYSEGILKGKYINDNESS